MKIALTSARIVDREINYNLSQMERYMKEAKAMGTDLVCLGEAFDYKGKKCVVGLCGDLWDYPERFALGEDLLLWPVYVCWTKEEWENSGKNEYAEQAKLCCENTLYVNPICDGDAFGGAAHFFGGLVQKELPIFNEGLLVVEV